MSSETTTYNVYRVYFEQSRGPDHEGIALVPAQNPNQNAGRFYHVKGTVGLGMDYDPHPGYRFGEIEGFKESILQFQFPRAMLGRFEEIAADQPPPYDPRALTEVNPDPPVKNCSDWSSLTGRSNTFSLPISSTLKPSLIKMAKTRSAQKRDTATPVKSKTTDSLKNTNSSFGGSLCQRLDKLEQSMNELEQSMDELEQSMDELEQRMEAFWPIRASRAGYARAMDCCKVCRAQRLKEGPK